MTNSGVLSDILTQKGHHPFVRVVVVSTAGSAPRGPGAAMLVTQDTTSGTIGGGQLELEAITHARRLLTSNEIDPTEWLRSLHVWPLGPALGQCCGGTVKLLFERYGRKEIARLTSLSIDIETDDITHTVLVHPILSGEPLTICKMTSETDPVSRSGPNFVGERLSGARVAEPALFQNGDDKLGYFAEPIARGDMPLFIYGAGHVGRAIVRIASDLDFDIHWVDTHDERLPKELPPDVRRVVARDPSIIAQAAPDGAFHVVLTYSHALDLAVCHALLAKSTFGFLGLIGSQTKRTKFRKRLLDAGLARPALAGLTCPIGIGGLRGKEPATIAVSIVAQLIERLEFVREANGPTTEGENGPSQRIPA